MLTKNQQNTVVSLRGDAELDDRISFVDLQAQQARIRPQVEAKIRAVLDHGQYIDGPEIEELERALSELTGAVDVVLCGSGTEALEIAMLTEGVGPGDAVFIPAFTYNATASAVIMLGATPVFVDVNTDTFNMSANDLRYKIDETNRLGELCPKMVIPVDLFGLPADYDAIGKITREYDLGVLADSAQSFGAQLGNQMVGNIVGMTATSFFPAKTLGCYGDGGAIFADSVERAKIWRSVRWHGTDTAHKESIRLGTNARMDSLQAAVLLVKLTIFEDELRRRRQIAKIYDRLLGPAMELPARPKDSVSAWAQYSIVLKDRDRVEAALAAADIPSAVYYRQPLHEMAAFKQYGPDGGLPNSEYLSRHILSLPMHPYLTEKQICDICATVVSAL